MNDLSNELLYNSIILDKFGHTEAELVTIEVKTQIGISIESLLE